MNQVNNSVHEHGYALDSIDRTHALSLSLPYILHAFVLSSRSAVVTQ